LGTRAPGSTTRGLAATPQREFELEQGASKTDVSAHATAGAIRRNAATELAALAQPRISPTLHRNGGIKAQRGHNVAENDPGPAIVNGALPGSGNGEAGPDP
jgi:hypothetical protein